MLAHITLLTGHSFHMDFGQPIETAARGSGLLELQYDEIGNRRFERLLSVCQSDDGSKELVGQLSRPTDHALPSLAQLDAWEGDAIRQEASRILDAQRQEVSNEAVAAVIPALRQDDSAAVVRALLPADGWQLLRGFWLCRPEDLAWAAYTPRNNDEVRVRARALLGIEGHAQSAREGVAFVDDHEISETARVRLVEAMGASKVAEAVHSLIALLEDANPSMQEQAVVALGKIGRSAALQPLLARWDTQDGRLRKPICVALRGLSSSVGANFLREFVESNSRVMAESAVFVSDQLERSDQLPKKWLLPLLASAEPLARRDAALLLAVFGDESDASALRSLSQLEGNTELGALARQGADNLARCGRKAPVDLVSFED